MLSSLRATTTNTTSAMFRRSLTATSFVCRRSFTTTARLRATNDKAPAKKPSSRQPPRLRKERQSNNNAREEELNISETIHAQFNPKSPHFILAFLNPKLTTEQRSNNLLGCTAVLFIMFISQPLWLSKEPGEWFPSQEAYIADFVRCKHYKARG